jgi:aminodeoxyfutalosine synthase
MNIVELVAEKIEKGERLSDEDALALFESPDLMAIGELADQVNRKKNSDQVFFNINRHINPTNICVLSCKFCAYSRKPGDEGAYAYSIDEMVKKAGEAVEQGATEVHMVGGLHPRWKFSYYLDMLKAIKAAYPELHIKAFTVVELNWMAQKERTTIGDILERLREAGLGSLPGGGAEIFHPEIRDQICENKVTAEMWLDTHKTAHGMGMQSNCTMLYGHIESFEHRVDHLRRVRETQDETKGFNAFIPLSFQPEHNEMGITRYTFGYDDLKTIAIARLYLDNFQHIKAYWVMLGQEIAQLALNFGANDLDGTVIEEKISRMAGGRAGMIMNRPQIESLIKKTGSIPVERDTLYQVIGTPPALENRQGARSIDRSEALASEARHRSIANQVTYGNALSFEDLSYLADTMSLHELAKLATVVRDQHNQPSSATVSLCVQPKFDQEKSRADLIEEIRQSVDACYQEHKIPPSTLCFDLSLGKSRFDDLGAMLETTWAFHQSFHDLEFSVQGLKSLWKLAQAEQASISDILGRLREAGVDCIESSSLESETDLTHSEVVDIHQQIHSREVHTIAKVELATPTLGKGPANWSSFIKRIRALEELQKQTNGITAIKVEASPTSYVTPVEYLRAIALARLSAPSVEHIIAPLTSMPSLSPIATSNNLMKQIPAQKFAPLCLHLGADDLGHIPYQLISMRGVFDEIRAAGFKAEFRDAHFGEIKGKLDDFHHSIKTSKHVPHEFVRI